MHTTNDSRESRDSMTRVNIQDYIEYCSAIYEELLLSCYLQEVAIVILYAKSCQFKDIYEEINANLFAQIKNEQWLK